MVIRKRSPKKIREPVIPHHLLAAMIRESQLILSPTDDDTTLIFNDYRIDYMLLCGQMVEAIKRNRSPPAKMISIDEPCPKIVLKYSKWFKPYVPFFDMLMDCDITDFNDFEVCDEIQAFFEAKDKLQTQYPQLIGLYEGCFALGKETYLKHRIQPLNQFIKLIRAILNGPKHRSAIAKRERKSRDEFRSLKEWIDAHFEVYSKLLVIRIDLGLKPPQSNLINNNLIDFNNVFHSQHNLSYLKNRVKRIRHNKSNNKLLQRIVGFAYKFEHGVRKGMHIHAMFLVNGQPHERDEYYANEISKYWIKLTHGQGCTYNCNREKKQYVNLGIGPMEYHDIEKRTNLLICLQYMSKSAQFFMFKPLAEIAYRAIQKSEAPQKRSKAGRPRKYANPDIVLPKTKKCSKKGGEK
ncbi:inovirus-type Gp2 protein [Acinetobacter baumannii]|uniref:hypothetical protein n=1 Tax=Acinetobacter baumannii TaxID=470 RepID=UPI00295637F3|nr:inovirus-type Gp2 protein [Acinetobacter baumannii]MDV7609600.1 inovirus-type Gp2 protein [Acinetobacter baumannii]MDV7611391.1 inovirus-type Gp2 protein [Acinetobacter baumannii]MDV7615544.1 inovirus-type Gp2 protein [Acinetobacter baumannii]